MVAVEQPQLGPSRLGSVTLLVFRWNVLNFNFFNFLTLNALNEVYNVDFTSLSPPAHQANNFRVAQTVSTAKIKQSHYFEAIFSGLSVWPLTQRL